MFVDHFANSPLSDSFDLYTPARLDGKRDQNSMIMARRTKFEQCSEVTEEVLSSAEEKIGCGNLNILSRK